MNKVIIFLLGICFPALLTGQQVADPVSSEFYRPVYHFTPKANWMNDPNGLVYHKGLYHLFFQYYPGATRWGPMHWGHATSSDLLTWKEQPIALYPDSLGYIFSGSAVVDKGNTSGFGREGKAPLVAIFTHHHPDGEKNGRKDYQVQSLAYSIDDGKTWAKYAGNPVLNNPGIADFRDPKVSWYEPAEKWIMTLATKDRIAFYSSPDLKEWTKESEFGETSGAHGGVWECPDLLPFDHNGKKMWILLVSINPGAPNGGSGTQYFVGDFDGKRFTPLEPESKWMDPGTDNYAGVTFFNTGGKVILIGWMSNWQYGQDVPTKAWRSAMTLPRELSIAESGGRIYLVSKPIKEVKKLFEKEIVIKNPAINRDIFEGKAMKGPGAYRILISGMPARDFSIVLSNEVGNELIIGFDSSSGNYFIDRRKSGDVGFEPGFAKKIPSRRVSGTTTIDLELYIDVASVEMFADNGLNVMTAIFFPNRKMDKLSIRSSPGVRPRELKIAVARPPANQHTK
ncbi:glycoside hydrolase family 32 protein [Flavihumibacter solisilvae]|uniref:Glycosyl hydrolase family 32 n=1 Tax=Flavihumibacter solisilvae TaxID=1349421 RepID=A0A0C1IM31_9BACT|nr:glycoside hydrolase family 32 protein [Flavihumibacter solisilvae]KIC95310.1 glycosyl hydrolase family 32 [Flavihumibacter solisilvae]